MFEKLASGIEKIRHLNRIRSVSWGRLLRLMPQVWLDYIRGRGISHSLVNVTLEVTYRCNAQCSFCFADKSLPSPGRQELSAEEIGAVAASVSPQGAGFFLTGGEPFVRSDMPEIIKSIKHYRLKVGINTNMSLLTQEIALALRDLNLDYLIASLHGPREIHDRLTGAAMYDAIIENIALLRRISPQTRVLVNCVILPENVERLSEVVVEIARAGAHALTLQHETFITREEVDAYHEVWRDLFGEGLSPPLNVPMRGSGRCDPAAVIASIHEAKHAGRAAGMPVFVKPDLSEAGFVAWYEGRFHPYGRCSYLYTDARITPYGDVVACQSLPLVLGNVRHQPLPEIFNNEAAAHFRRCIRFRGGSIPGCARCCKLYRSF